MLSLDKIQPSRTSQAQRSFLWGGFWSDKVTFKGNKFTCEEAMLKSLTYMAHGMPYMQMQMTLGHDWTRYSNMVEWYTTFLYHKFITGSVGDRWNTGQPATILTISVKRYSIIFVLMKTKIILRDWNTFTSRVLEYLHGLTGAWCVSPVDLAGDPLMLLAIDATMKMNWSKHSSRAMAANGVWRTNEYSFLMVCLVGSITSIAQNDKGVVPLCQRIISTNCK